MPPENLTLPEPASEAPFSWERPELGRMLLKTIGRILLGLLFFFGTQSVITGTVVPAVLAAWPAFVSAFWVRRADENRVRGQVCFLLLLTTGLWNGAVSGLITILAALLAVDFLKIPIAWPQVAPSFVLLFAGMLLSSLLGVFPFFLAWRHGLKVWVHPEIGQQLNWDLRHLNHSRRRLWGINRAFLVGATSVSIPVTVLAFGPILWFAFQGGGQLGFWQSLVSITCIFAVPTLGLYVAMLYFDGICAQVPHECWPEYCPRFWQALETMESSEHRQSPA